MQQVNLLNSLPQKESTRFSAKQHLVINLLFIGALSVPIAFGYIKQSNIRDRLTELQQKQLEANETLKRVAGKLEQLKESDALKKTLSFLERQRTVKQILLDDLKTAEQQAGLANYLVAIAKAIPAKIWIEKITMVPAQKKYALQGKSRDVHLLPEFMQRLNERPLFQKNPFDSLNILQMEKDKSIVTFSLATDETISE